MTFDFVYLPLAQRILPPNGALGWVLWLAWLGLLLARLAPRVKEVGSWSRRQWGSLLALALSAPLALMLVVLQLPADGMLPIPGLGAPATGILLPLLAALPWMLAAAWMGQPAAALIGGLSGVFMAVWDTRSPFTPLEMSTLAVIFAGMLRQPFRSRFFGVLRRPLPAALILALVFPLLYVLVAPFWAGTSLTASLDFAVSRLPWVTLAMATQLLAGALILRQAQSCLPSLQPQVEARTASPAERSLEGRLLFALGPVVLVLFLALAALTWFAAGSAAATLQEERVHTSVEIAAESVPFMLETGQTLMEQLAADPRLYNDSPGEAQQLLQDYLNAVPYFEQFVYLDPDGNTLAAFPVADFSGLQPGQRELDAVNLALQGVPLQFFSIPPLESGGNSAQLAFVSAVRDEAGDLAGALVGRTRLGTNPFAQPVVASLKSIEDLGGQALLLDGENRIVYSPSGTTLLTTYGGQTGESALAYEDVGPDGGRRQVLYQPATGSAWAVVAQVPASLAQQLALGIVWPILLVLLVLALLAYALLRLSLRSVTVSLQDLVDEARRIASGDLDAPLTVRGADEVGRLGQAFETMRQRLKGRMEENQRLLTVSQRVAASLEVRSHIDPILEAALAGGAKSARLVFSAVGLPEQGEGGMVGFGRGELNEPYQGLDSQILPMTKTQARVLLTNPARARLSLPTGAPMPAAVAAFALEHEGEHLGALWLAYDVPQVFEPESVRYLETLAGQAALAAANTRLYLNARIGRQRMEAVLAATPDPVLVADQGGRILLANPAALKLFGRAKLPAQGERIQQLSGDESLLALFRSDGPASGELRLGNGRAYFATVTPIEIDGERMGRACVLRDITQFKQTEAIRSEFLSTVSHDLRDPLELVRGYVTMLGMVGELNTQQEGYAEKIEYSLSSLVQLVDNLLDLERIESGQGLQVERFAILDVLGQVREGLLPRARQKQVDVIIEQPQGSLPPLEADRTLLQRALHNLLDNAIKFSPRGKKVRIAVEASGNHLTVAITDQGTGIAPVDLQHIFELLYRVEGEEETGPGGLGLAIVKSIVERHGGRVWADSELGLGSRFYMELPLKPQDQI